MSDVQADTPRQLADSGEAIEQPLRRSPRLLPTKKPAAVQTQPKKSKRAQPEVSTALPEETVAQEEQVSTVTLMPLTSRDPAPPDSRDRSLTGITSQAKKLREQDPGKYGVKGARKGMPGYVKNGWKLALADAAEALGCKSKAAAKNKRAQKTLTHQQKDAKQAYLEELRLLQVKYFPLIGRKVSAKATKQAAKKAVEDSDIA